ncbi:amino acid adenylation domain-containing protein [Nocardia sp. NBC_01499]|uniref:hybrid non-ribosomal peptide synthetase/type I polyketide synthase n=1 Tax=Nocardia sp. NBC_01499 TaxID=2903597 RepID=UPI00386FFC65
MVAMSCRFGGGANSVDAMWDTMVTSRDTVSEIPTDRGWDLGRLCGTGATRATSSTRFGNFLCDATDFDAGFFGISPREAVAMEPQQRVLLETSWEAIERAGIDPRSLRGSRTGVYFGVMQAEYGPRMADMERTKGYQDTGVAASVASGRVAYALGLRGPALSIDTACSSSLVAIHTAMKALRSGECSMALAGGGTIHSTASLFVGFSVLRVLSEDGTTRPFASAATGFGLGEGVGVLVLERLRDAQRLGHPVAAVLCGSAIASDGASASLSAPDQLAQQEAIEYALADAGLGMADIDVVEAHGTGTRVGDPIEVAALTATYGGVRSPDRPLWIGSAKSNFGHTQAGSGVAGVIKMVESIRRGIVPATKHYDVPSPHIDWSSGTVRVANELMAWPARSGAPRRGAVSANGISGVNCHVIIEQAPATSDAGPPPRRELPVVPLVLSARTDAALRAQAARLADHLRRRPQLRPADVGHSLATGRAAFDKRAVVLGADAAELTDGLAEVATGSAPVDTSGGVVFVFPGQGPQWQGMAIELLDTAPAFAEHMARCEAALAEFVDWSVTDVLRGAPGAPPLERVDVIQPVLFTVMVALARTWEALGVRPAAVIGHSQGEIAAAHIAGALTLREAVLVVTRRSAIMMTASGNGSMVAVPLPVDEARELVGGALAVACVNSPGSCVLSGNAEDVEHLLRHCAANGIDARKVPASLASHSPLVEPLRSAIEEALATITPRSSAVPFLSTVTGDVLDTANLDAHYWYRNTRDTVRFEDAVRAAHRAGARVFLEVSAHPVLSVGVHETVAALAAESDQATAASVVGTLRRNEGGLRRFLTSAGQLYSVGVAVDWGSYFTDSGARRVDLPTYPFQRQRFWMMPDEGLAIAFKPRETASRQLNQTVETPIRQPDLNPDVVVREAVAAVLGYRDRELVPVAATFKELGLDSLASLELRNRLATSTGVRFTVADLVEQPTPGALAARLRTELACSTRESAAVAELARPAGTAWPLSPYQADLVAVGARYPELPVVQAAYYIRVDGATDVDGLRTAILGVQSRHDALRLRFDIDAAPPVQRLVAVPDAVGFVDFRTESDPVAALAQWTRIRTDTVLPLDGPQSEFTILRDACDSLIVFSRFHHAVADGWSSIVIAREISAAYHGAEPATTAPSFLAMLDGYRGYRESGQWTIDRAALVERFLPLTPAVFARSSTGNPLRRCTRSFGRSAVNGVRATGSVVALLLAAVGVQLRRFHQHGDIVVGVTLLNRETPTELAMVGDLTNILPVHIPVAEAATLTELGDLVEAQVRDIQGRQRFSYGDLLRALRERTGNMPTLFDIRLTYNKIPDSRHAERLRRDVSTLSAGYALDAMTIVVNEYAHDGTVDVEIFYSTDIFDEAAFDSALRAVLATLAAPTAPLALAATPTALVGATVDFDATATLPQLLADTAARYPDRPALTWTTADNQIAALTYRELLDRVRTLAACLREYGLRADEFVPVLLPRSPELVIAIHAVVAAGAAYVPISPDYPQQRIRTLLADSDARVLIGNPEHAAEYGIDVIAPDGQPTRHTEPATCQPTDLAYMIYTSGSTGTPKGVMIEHRSVVNLLAWLQRRYPLSETDVILHKTPHTFDVSVPELWWLTQTGVQVAVLPDGAHIDPRQIIDAVERHRVTVVQFVPSMLGPFLDELEATPGAIRRVGTLRFILCAGEALPSALVRRFGDLFAAADLDNVVLANLYGPTEATVYSTYFDITVADARKTTAVPIGEPIDNVVLTIAETDRRPVDTGQLVIAGAGLARGYHNRSELTAQAFTTDGTVRSYQTGDLARVTSTGDVEYLGRIDDQVKIRGNRVTLGEVTTHLAECPGVSAAAVLDDTNAANATVLIAYYSGTAAPGEIAAFLRDRLPDYAIPAVFVPLPSIPRSHNGKADRNALHSLRDHLPVPLSRNEIEALLIEAWTEVLGSTPNPDDHFFTTGGDSISALQFRAAIERRGLKLKLNDLFTNPTIAGLARRLA